MGRGGWAAIRFSPSSAYMACGLTSGLKPTLIGWAIFDIAPMLGYAAADVAACSTRWQAPLS